MAFKGITEEQYRATVFSDAGSAPEEPLAKSVWYDPTADRLFIELPSGRIVGVLRTDLREWRDLSTDQLAHVRLSAVGDALAHDGHDVQIGVEGLLRDTMMEELPQRALAAIFAARGGRTVSLQKSIAARRNGLRGGRPKKPKTTKAVEVT
jgi:hypothetical protein